MADTVNLTIDGKPAVAPKGMNLIEAAKSAGIEVPHYCYHPKLPVVGNCRMCLVDVGMPKMGPDKKPELGPDGKPVIMFAPKLSIGCNTTVAEGMVVLTRSPKVIKAREGVMEFLLINHPLDCPICDQAGECRLQEFSVDYGKGQSRFVEHKVNKPKHTPLGPKIMLDDERCILCSRCVRFMRDVAGQDCLGFVNRGSYSTLTCYPGMEPNTNYDLNIADICPVGALTSNGFPVQAARLVPERDQERLPELRHGLQHGALVARRRGPSPDAARQRRGQPVLDVRFRPAQLQIHQ